MPRGRLAQIRQNKFWKNIIVGKAQRTGTPDHQFRSYREAIKMAQSGQYEKVYFNRGYNQITGQKVFPNRRPDVVGVRKTGEVDVIEVPSKTDRIDDLIQRNMNAQRQLPPHRRGNIDVIEIQ